MSAVVMTSGTRVSGSGQQQQQKKKRQEVESYLNNISLDVSKGMLRSPHLDLFCESETEMYLFLYVYFQRRANTQKHEDGIAIREEDVVNKLLRGVLLKHIHTLPQGAKKSVLAPPPSSASATTTSADNNDGDKREVPPPLPLDWISTDSGPFITQRALREDLTAQGVNTTAFAEVVEMCRYLDDVMASVAEDRRKKNKDMNGRRSGGVDRNENDDADDLTIRKKRTKLGGGGGAIGMVNVLHFVAVYMTLCPTPSLFDLFAKLFAAESEGGSAGARKNSSSSSPLSQQQLLLDDGLKVRILHCWALIDAANHDALIDLCWVVINHRNLTLPLLLELFPAAREINTVGDYTAPTSIRSSSGGAAAIDQQQQPPVSNSTTAATTTTTNLPSTVRSSSSSVVAVVGSSGAPLVIASHDPDADAAPPTTGVSADQQEQAGAGQEEGYTDNDTNGEDEEGRLELPPEDRAFWDSLVQ